ncbi:Sensory transduction protein RegX3 [uncultured Gammaproteobacteria bacterium]
MEHKAPGTDAHLLIVEDDLTLRLVMAGFLTTEGFRVTQAATGAEFLAALDREAVDLVLLDLELPDEDGMVLARQVRERSSVPIIMVTGRDARADRLAGLHLGADDYITKPFDPEELVARVRMVLRRSLSAPAGLARDVCRFGPWTLDHAARTLRHEVNGLTRLTYGEFNLMAMLMRAAGEVVGRERLVEVITREGEAASSQSLDVLISRLRAKIEANPRLPVWVVTVPRLGYRFCPDGK